MSEQKREVRSKMEGWGKSRHMIYMQSGVIMGSMISQNGNSPGNEKGRKVVLEEPKGKIGKEGGREGERQGEKEGWKIKTRYHVIQNNEGKIARGC